jgi:hypothetical protein
MISRLTVTPALLVVLTCIVSANEPNAKDKALVSALKGVKARPSGFGKTVISDVQEAAKVFGEADLGQVQKQVDFAKQKLVGFAWEGSHKVFGFDFKEQKGKVNVRVWIISPKRPAGTVNDAIPKGEWLVMPKDAIWERLDPP